MDLAAAIEPELNRFLRHAALWKAVNPLWDGAQKLGFTEALASRKSLAVAQDDNEILRILGEWQAFLNPDTVFAAFQEQLAAGQASPLAQQYALWVHGKLFRSQVVAPVMARFFGQAPEKRRRLDILNALAEPTDLQPIFKLFAS